jgi:class III poly(R)-hydroxyalkanoic acid synthase PhaE subunit
MTDSTKDWTDMATEMVNTWTETGSLMWRSWFDLMNSVPIANAVNKAVPELKHATQQFLDNRELTIRFLQLSVDAWKEIFPKIESGDDWQTTLKKSIEQMQEQLNTLSSSAMLFSKDTGELWRIYIQQMQKFNQVWLDPMGIFHENISKAATGQPSALIELNNLYWNLLYEESFGSLMQTPLLGLPREFNRELLEGFEAWQDLYRSTIDYQVILGDVQIRSFKALMNKLVSLAEEGKPVRHWKDFQTVWSIVADEVFEDTFCQEKNLKIRGNFLNSLNVYRIRQQKLMEFYLKMMNMPSRSEVDEIHKNIYELRKEVRSLKKALAKQGQVTINN